MGDGRDGQVARPRAAGLAALVATAAASGLVAAALPAAAASPSTPATPAGPVTGPHPAARPGPLTDAGAPVPVLDWHPCAGPSQRGFQCATGRVPLSYTAPTGPTIDIAVIKHPAAGPGPRAGSLFFNPGGPGGSGTSALPKVYRFFPAALRQRFDIVSFDPRGVGESTAVQCFPDLAAQQRFFAARPSGFPVGAAQERRWISLEARFGQLCEQRDGWLLPHLATADVARDMDLLRQAVGDHALNYLGVSYGSYLGATYANLFPSNVHAMVLDGIVAPTAWARPRSVGRVPLGTFLRVAMDTGQKATLGQFLDLCGQASPGNCAFSAGSAPATRARYATLLRRLRRHPVTVTIAGKGTVRFTYAALVSDLASSLYIVAGWPAAARALAAAWQASGRSAAHRAAGRVPGATAGARYSGEEQGAAVLCADSPDPRDPASYPVQAAFGYARSGAFGPSVTWQSEVCATWPATDADGYYGPWNHRTASPILVVNTIYDPATPYVNAPILIKELARSRLLTLAGSGHTALLNPSACVNRYESSYFLTGTLPPPGTVCRQDHQPFSTSPRR
ncbi:MAG TPA: alpha/beta hydrolase [Streptosporangiaceae bacterium]|nr:alpha/beta hydrolase [Streptosporangiaceae bacterium]